MPDSVQVPVPDLTNDEVPDVLGLPQTGVSVPSPVPFSVKVGLVDAVLAKAEELLKISAPLPEAVIVAPFVPTVKRRSVVEPTPV